MLTNPLETIEAFGFDHGRWTAVLAYLSKVNTKPWDFPKPYFACYCRLSHPPANAKGSGKQRTDFTFSRAIRSSPGFGKAVSVISWRNASGKYRWDLAAVS